MHVKTDPNNDSLRSNESSWLLEDGPPIVAGEEHFDGDGDGSGAISPPCIQVKRSTY